MAKRMIEWVTETFNGRQMLWAGILHGNRWVGDGGAEKNGPEGLNWK